MPKTKAFAAAAALLLLAAPAEASRISRFEAYSENLPAEEPPRSERKAARAEGRPAKMWIESRRKEVPAGGLVRLKIMIDSGEQAVNAAQAEASYPAELLELVAVDNTESDFSLFLELREVSPGVIRIACLQPFPGLAGRSRVADLLFRAREGGRAAVSLSDAAVLANDGFGTDVLGDSAGISFAVAD